MLKYAVQTRLFAILWVIQTIHKEEPMYAVFDKFTIKTEILPYLSTAKRGYEHLKYRLGCFFRIQ